MMRKSDIFEESVKSRCCEVVQYRVDGELCFETTPITSNILCGDVSGFSSASQASVFIRCYATRYYEHIKRIIMY